MAVAINRTIKKGLLFLGVITALGVCARLLIHDYLNKKISIALEKTTGYHTKYEDLAITFIEGGYSLRQIEMRKDSSKVSLPFFTAEKITFSIEWKSLLQGSIVTEVLVEKPILNFVKGRNTQSSQTSVEFDWINLIRKTTYFPVNTINITQGEIHYYDFHSTPKIDLVMNEVTLAATNLNNTSDEEKILSAKVEASAKAYEGTIRLKMDVNAFYKSPMFHLTAELNNLDLYHLNNFLKAYGNYDVQNGLFSMYTEAATRNNKILGVVKPVFEGINVASWDNKENNLILLKPWSTGETPAFSTVGSNERIPQEIRFEGNADEPGLNLWTAAGITLHNAFIEALMPSLEESMNKNGINRNMLPRKKKSATAPASISRDDEKKPGLLRRIFKRKEDKGKREQRRKKNEENN